VPGIVSRITAFARSPQGQRVITTATRKAQEIARDPRTKEKVQQLRERAAQRRGGSGGTPPR
jgi:hypothetical protein